MASTDKSGNLTCEIIYDNLTVFKDCPLYNKQKNTWVLGNTRFISHVEHDISLVRCAHS